MLLAFTRQLLRLEKTGARGAAEKAETLELAARAALTEINRQITHIRAGPITAKDEQFIGELCAVAIALLALAMFLAEIRSRMAARGMHIGAVDFAGIAAVLAAVSNFDGQIYTYQRLEPG